MAKASFAAGCFWGIQSEFNQLLGVTGSIVGYTGGKMKNPSYEDILTDTTGHAEAVQVSYDSKRVTYVELLKHFFEMHNPSTMPGKHYKYRTTIFYHTQEQKKIAHAFLAELKETKLYDLSIKTSVEKIEIFYKAEEYHQEYYRKQGISL